MSLSKTQRQQMYTYSRHLDSALEYDKIDFYLKFPDLWGKSYPGIPVSTLHPQDNGSILGHQLFRTIETYITSCTGTSSSTSSVTFPTILSVVHEAIDLQVLALCPREFRIRKELLDSKIATLRSNTHIQEVFACKRAILCIHDDLRDIGRKGVFPAVIPQCPNIQVTKDMVTLTNIFPKTVTLPFTFLLAVLDKLESRFLSTIYSVLIDCSSKYQGLEFYSLYQYVYTVLEEAHRTLGNAAADLYKLLEPICVSSVLETQNPLTNDHNYWAMIEADLAEGKPHVISFCRLLRTKFSTFLQQHGERGIPAVLELYGQEKMHYYPIVDLEGGLLKMYRFGTSLRPIRPETVNEIVGQLTRDIVIAKYNKDGKIPHVLIPGHVCEPLKQMLTSGRLESISYCERIPLMEWSKVVLLQNAQFNYFTDIVDLLDDKAISPPLSKINQLYDRAALLAYHLPPVVQPSHTRLILEALDKGEIDVSHYFRTMEESGNIPKEWTLIQLKAKERELKRDPRDFSILSFPLRMCASVLERNLADAILGLLKTHSMSSSGSQLRSTIDKMSTLRCPEGETWVTFHIDLEQWNYTFRGALMSQFVFLFNSYFGVEHYSLALRLFTQGLLVSACRFCPFGSTGSFHAWDHHVGGNQGIFQKLWTLITIAVIRRVMTILQLEHMMTGSGDNQVVSVKLPLGPDLPNKVKDIKQSLAQAFKEVGLQVKVSETWHSDTLLSYQRKYFFKGIPLGNGLKETTRAFSGTSDMNGGLNSIISTSMNSGINIAESTSDPYTGMICAYLECYSTLMLTPSIALSSRIPPRRLVALSLAGSELGYLPFVQLPHFLYAGHKDPLSESLGLIFKLWEEFPGKRQDICWLLPLTRKPFEDTQALPMILDPGSLNIKRPAAPEAVIRSQVEEFLRDPSNVKNNKLSNLFTALNPVVQENFARELLKIKPVHLTLLHSLYETSPIGHISSVTNRFNKLSSIVKLVNRNEVRKGTEPLVNRIVALDRQAIRHIQNLASAVIPTNHSIIHLMTQGGETGFREFCTMHGFHPNCVFSVRLYLVSWSYYKNPELIKGPFLPPSTEQLVFHSGLNPEVLANSLMVTPAFNIPVDQSQIETTRGPFRLYVGARTKDPVQVLTLSNLEGLEAGKAVKQLLRIFTWIQTLESTDAVVRGVGDLIDSRVPGLRDMLVGLGGGTSGGTFAHRFDMSGDVSGCFTSSQTLVSTWYQLSSNGATKLQRGSEDRYIFFQQLHQHIFSVLRLIDPPRNKFSVEVRLDHCSYLVDDEPFKGEPNLETILSSTREGTGIPPYIRLQLAAEALHTLQIKCTYDYSNVDPILVLGSAIAFQQMQIYRSYRLGTWDKEAQLSKTGGPQDSFNVTLMRLVPLEVTLRSMCLQFILQRVFYRTPNLFALRANFERLLATPSSLTDAAVYQDFLDAIIVSGQLMKLKTLSGKPLQWDSGANHLALLPNLLKALVNSCSQLIDKRTSTAVMVEIKTPSYDTWALERFCRSISFPFRRWLKNHQRSAWGVKLSKYSEMTPNVPLVITTDVNSVIEKGRNHPDLAISQAAYDIPKEISQTTLVQLTVPPTNPLILVELSTRPNNDNGNAMDVVVPTRSWQQEDPIKEQSQVARWNLVSSGAKYKLLEIIARTNINVSGEGVMMSVAEGAGSYLSSLLHLNPIAQGLYNTLITPEEMAHSYSHTFIPPETVCPCGVHQRIINVPYIPERFGDLSQLETWNELTDHLANGTGPILMLTWDMEGSSNNKDTSFLYLKEFIAVNRPNNVVVKFFVQEFNKPSFITLLGVTSLYQRATVIKPSTSAASSGELFLVLVDPTSSENLSKLAGIASVIDQMQLLWDKLSWESNWPSMCKLSKWTASLNSCPQTSPTDPHFLNMHHHPIERVLINLVKIIDKITLGGQTEGFSLSKEERHLVESSTRGARTTWDVLLCQIVLVRVFLKVRMANLWAVSSDEDLEMWIKRGDVVLSGLAIMDQCSDPSWGKRYLLRCVGEIITCPMTLNVSNVLYLCKDLEHSFKSVPNSWEIKSLESLLTPGLVNMIQSCPYSAPAEELTPVLARPVQGVVWNWMNQIGHELGGQEVIVTGMPHYYGLWASIHFSTPQATQDNHPNVWLTWLPLVSNDTVVPEGVQRMIGFSDQKKRVTFVKWTLGYTVPITLDDITLTASMYYII